jgi:AAA15 family ATPase/GTPase
MKIQSKNGLIQIADKGMGSIQAMLLIMRIACVIRKIKNIEANLKTRRSNNRWTDLNSNLPLFLRTMLIIEEPELNLHPALQSKLAEMFLDVHLKFKIDFLVETHSEYLIRKTQLLVKENEFESKQNFNPFTVIYFDKDSTQWNINYREDGKFIEDFGKGFYDEATLLTLNLL